MLKLNHLKTNNGLLSLLAMVILFLSSPAYASSSDSVPDELDQLIATKLKLIHAYLKTNDIAGIIAECKDLIVCRVFERHIDIWASAHCLMGGYEFRANKFDQAFKHFSAAGNDLVRQRAPKSWLEAQVGSGDCHFQNKNYGEAKSCYDSAITKEAKQMNHLAWQTAHLGMARMYGDMGYKFLYDYHIQQCISIPPEAIVLSIASTNGDEKNSSS